MSTVPYTFATAVGNIPLSQLDVNFANVKAFATTAGTVTSNAQANITSVGTLTGLAVNGDVSATGNVYASNLVGNIVGNIIGDISTTGNITAGYFIGNGSLLTGISGGGGGNGISNGNSNVVIETADGNVTVNTPAGTWIFDASSGRLINDTALIQGPVVAGLEYTPGSVGAGDVASSAIGVDLNGVTLSVIVDSGPSNYWEFLPSGETLFPGDIYSTGSVVQAQAVTVAQLPAAVNQAGARAVVTNASSNVFGAVATGGGSNIVPVYSDGTRWRVG